MNIRFLAPARAELRDAIKFYEDQRPGLGISFRDEVHAAVERVAKHPKAWRALSPNTRRHRIQKFPYGVIYAIDADEVLIIAIAHSHRDPDYWRERAK